jgi:hypothetical protein
MEDIKNTNEKPSIKDNWLKEDILCEKCGQVVYRQKGITKQSMKRLFSFDYKNTQEWVWTIVIIGICFLAWSYMQDKKAYDDFMEHRTQYCTQLLSSIEYNNREGIENETDIDGFENGLDLDGDYNTTNSWTTQ